VLLQVYERALPYFGLAAAIQPQEVKWSLMVASCYRRIGAYDQALLKYVEAQRNPPIEPQWLYASWCDAVLDNSQNTTALSGVSADVAVLVCVQVPRHCCCSSRQC
jgi:tetratricopeptide (TPR) repeat protein